MTGPAAVIVDASGANIAEVKAASTAAVAADKALVVAVSPNNTVPVSVASLPLPAGAATQATLATLLTQSDFDTRVGEVQASPTAYTLLARLKDAYDAIVARLGTLGQKAMTGSTPVVIASDQSTVPVSLAAVPATGDRVASGSFTAAAQTVVLTALDGAGDAGVQITGTWVGEIVCEATIDGSNWFAIVGYSMGLESLAKAEATANTQCRIVCAGFASLRLRASAWTSGTANVTIRASLGSSINRANISQTAYSPSSNATTTPLGIGGVFTGTAENCISTMGLQINVFTDEDSAYEGLRVEQSMDGSNWDIVDHFTVLADVGFSRTIQSTATYCRVVYTNGGVAQTVFRLQLVLVPMIEALPRSTGHNGGLITEPRESPTFTVLAPDVQLGNGKSLLSLCMAAGDPRVLRLREVWIRNAVNSAVTGVAAMFELRRVTGHSADTTLTPVSRDSDDTLPTSTTARTGATVTGEGAVEQRWEWSSDEWGPGTLDVEGHAIPFQNLWPVLRKHDPQTKPPSIRAGQGYHVKCATNTTAGYFDILFVFTVET